ncbi:MAG: hypothetical protein H6809_04735 [Phycisphaeraceae bacterium]|nr:hypothetical protein [Phycisphaeraceae bacterium]
MAGGGRESGSVEIAWIDAAGDPGVADALGAVFRNTALAIEARGPACWASGRCCNFEAAGHRLYTTGLEAAFTVVRLGDDAAIAGNGDQERGAGLELPQIGRPSLTPASIAAARERGGCPFQRRNLCTVHDIKPVACRVYFCDRSAQDWQKDLSEQLHERVRVIHEEFGVPYEYAEWRGLLERLVAARDR